MPSPPKDLLLNKQNNVFEISVVNTYIAVHNRNHHTAIGNHLPYGITQCYLPPGRGDFPAFTAAEAGTRFSDSGEMQS